MVNIRWAVFAPLEPKVSGKYIVGGCGVWIGETVTLYWDVGSANWGSWKTISAARQTNLFLYYGIGYGVRH